MDVTQLAQMVSWLDEEHRRDRAEIARLQQRLEAQSADVIEQARRIQDLEGRLANTQAHFSRFNQVDSAIQNTKTELVSIVERGEEARVQFQREIERSRLGDREALSREISEVRRELPRVNRLEESLDVRVVEDERLSELIIGVRNQIGGLAKEIEERTRQIPFLAEQRTSDTKRIAQLQQETVELFKRIEAQVGRLGVVEEDVRRTATEAEKVPPQVDELREKQEAFMERTRVMVVDREQVINRWQEVIEEQKTLVSQAHQRVQSFAQQIDVARRSVSEIQEFKDMVLREQSQVQELQRLSEERLRREMDEFREEFEKQRRRDDLRQEHLWTEQEKYNESVLENFPPLRHDIKVVDRLMQEVWKLQESYSNYFLGSAQVWVDGLDQALRQREETVRGLEEERQRQQRNAELYANNNAPRLSGITTGEPPIANNARNGRNGHVNGSAR